MIVGRGGRPRTRTKLINDLNADDKKQIKEDQDKGQNILDIAKKRNVAVPTIKQITQYKNQNGVVEVEIIHPTVVQKEKINAVRAMVLSKLLTMAENVIPEAEGSDKKLLNIANTLYKLYQTDVDNETSLDGMSKILQQTIGRPFLKIK